MYKDIDITKISQKLLDELGIQELIYKSRAEGVRLLYDRLIKASATDSEPTGTKADEREDSKEELPIP